MDNSNWQKPIMPDGQPLQEPQAPPVPESTPPPVHAHHSARKRKVLVAVAVAIVLVIAAFVGWLMFIRDAKKDTQSAATPPPATATAEETPTTEASLNPQSVITKIRDGLAKKYTVLNVERNNQPQTGQVSVGQGDVAPAYKAEGDDYYTYYNGGASLSALFTDYLKLDAAKIPVAADVTFRGDVATIFKDFGLAKTGSRGDNDANVVLLDVYEGKGLVCTVDQAKADTNGTHVNCGKVSDYKRSAEKVKPFATAWSETKSSSVFGDLEISGSQTSGYQKATLSTSFIDAIGGSLALFYKKGDADWAYFKNSQEVIACSEYATADLRAAFKGDPCYTNGELATVQ